MVMAAVPLVQVLATECNNLYPPRLIPSIGFRFVSRLLVVALAFAIVGCGTTKPQDVTGTWIISRASRDRYLPDAQRGIAGTIVLSADGTFTATEVPEELASSIEGARSISANGVWSLIDHNGTEVHLEFRVIRGRKEYEVPYGNQLSISMGFPRSMSLYYFQGHIDDRRRVEFERK